MSPGARPEALKTCQVLVLGGGMAGLCAALAAAQAGVRVALADPAEARLIGGNARHGRNLRLPHAAPTGRIVDRYPGQELLADLTRIADPEVAGEALWRALFVAQAARVPGWLAAAGVAFQSPGDGLLPYSRKTAFFLGGGQALVNALVAAVRHHRVALCPGWAGRAVDPKGPTVGLEHAAGERLEVSPPALVVASGGYQANRGWLAETWGEAARHLVVRGTPHAEGALLRQLLDHGAAPVGAPGACHLVAVDGRAPRFDGGIITRVDGLAHGIVVDRLGRRVTDETVDSGPTRYSRWGWRVAHMPAQIAHAVFDADGLAAGQRQGPCSVFPPLTAPDLTTLALLIGVHGPSLIRAARSSGRVGNPPFAAFPIRPGITATHHGVAVDTSGRVRRASGGVWPAVFAAGTVMAPTLLGTGYLAGSGLTIAAVSGRLAGQGAALTARQGEAADV
ncbi:FAD-dependent tricarballylate dehydrogenase TcuA [Roseospirillum parvum]|uniref:Tricarballylate dehydrogenase n=1 Tax=Roseospirillum parvum TaxID=83401 RepID=A0A1G8ATX8_9PROT|nr:FAD-dependent tricarballylate dehydrogenase TcuA [Roseospirillum parvum]SDH24263.1 tricarballylate dehydrogenase [Roseospirillum parvum]